MHEQISINRLHQLDIDMYQCGSEDCRPGHAFGPAVRDFFLIHYVLSGKGIFQVGNKIYHLRSGQGFLICPDIVTFYKADETDPWHYSWVGFHGLKAEQYLKLANLTAETPIFTYDRDDSIRNCFKEMIEVRSLVKGREIKLTGLLYLFLSQLIEAVKGEVHSGQSEDRKQQYVRHAMEYIEKNYSNKISIKEISHYIGLDRSYFCSIFKEYSNCSPQEFLIQFRMNKACELMKNDILSIGDISRSVGYEDPLLFSRMFKKEKGMPPREYRSRGGE